MVVKVQFPRGGIWYVCGGDKIRYGGLRPPEDANLVPACAPAYTGPQKASRKKINIYT
jgi:hypothetical protein